MSCCSQSSSQSSSNNTCGSSKSTITIPQNAIAASLTCSLPCVREFSTSLFRFRNQIVREVLTALSARCKASVPPTLPPGTLIVLSNTTTFDQSLAATINLEIEATTIDSVNVLLQNVVFNIVGFASVIVQISGDVIITIVYQGVDSLTHTQTTTVPFVFTETVAGTFPPNVIVQGSLSISNQLVVNEIDPSTLAITAVSVTLFFADNIIILVTI